MSYQVFARKYRPRTFKDVLGQDHVVRTLCNAIEQKRLAHAYLFVGPRGTGKTSTARIFAKALNCSGGPKVDFDPDEEVCREIAEGRNLDVQEIDGASNRGIDNIRDLRDYVQFAPSSGSYRIVYIDEVHMLTKESFNALLKTLEEPPPHVMFIFATTEPHKILPTILSRCQRFDLRPIPTDIIANHLVNIAANEGVTLTQSAAYAIATVAEGGMRDAQSMLDQLVSFCGNHIDEQNVNDIFGVTGRETVAKALVYILDRQLPSLLHLVHELAEAGRDMGQLLAELMGAVRELLITKVAPQEASAGIPEQWRDTLNTLLERTPTDKIIRLMEVLSRAEEQMRHSSNKRLYLEMGLIQAVHSLAEANISDIIRALNGAPLPDTPIATVPLPAVCTAQQAVPAAAPVQPTPAPQPAPAPVPAPVAEPQPAPAPEPSPVLENVTMPPGLEQLDDPPPLFDVPADVPQETVATERPVTPEDWDAMLATACEASPISGSMVGQTMFIQDDEGLLTIAIHPEDVNTRDALLSESIMSVLNEQAQQRCGRSISLRIVHDATVAAPTPVEILPPPKFEEVAPAPAPKPVQKEAPKQVATEAEKKAAPPSLKPTEEEFYNDPLIEMALKTFHATLIKN
ncbi:MAG: DNA polymerase III subunit gamma/tau [Akkermansia sp.]|nr:DNA polymerase III subunit gamma/tau [Akkermansia sp.]